MIIYLLFSFRVLNSKVKKNSINTFRVTTTHPSSYPVVETSNQLSEDILQKIIPDNGDYQGVRSVIEEFKEPNGLLRLFMMESKKVNEKRAGQTYTSIKTQRQQSSGSENIIDRIEQQTKRNLEQIINKDVSRLKYFVYCSLKKSSTLSSYITEISGIEKNRIGNEITIQRANMPLSPQEYGKNVGENSYSIAIYKGQTWKYSSEQNNSHAHTPLPPNIPKDAVIMSNLTLPEYTIHGEIKVAYFHDHLKKEQCENELMSRLANNNIDINEAKDIIILHDGRLCDLQEQKVNLNKQNNDEFKILDLTCNVNGFIILKKVHGNAIYIMVLVDKTYMAQESDDKDNFHEAKCILGYIDQIREFKRRTATECLV